jgi:hypothetical protein
MSEIPLTLEEKTRRRIVTPPSASSADTEALKARMKHEAGREVRVGYALRKLQAIRAEFTDLEAELAPVCTALDSL